MGENPAALELVKRKIYWDKTRKQLEPRTASFFSMVSGKWRELKGRVLEIFVRSM